MAQKRPTKKPAKKQLVKAYFPPSEVPKLEKLAEKRGLSLSALIVSTVLNAVSK